MQHFAYQSGTKNSEFPAGGGELAVPNTPVRCCIFKEEPILSIQITKVLINKCLLRTWVLQFIII